MISDPNEIAKIWQEELEQSSSAILQSSLVGFELEKTPVTVTIQVPTVLFNAITNACKRMGMTEDTYQNVFTTMASHGFQKSIDDKLTQLKSSFSSVVGSNDIQMPGVGGIGDIKTQLDQLGALINQVNTIKGAMGSMKTGGLNNVVEVSDPRKTNCPESALPTGQVAGTKSK